MSLSAALNFCFNAFKSATQLRPGETNVAPELLKIRRQLSDLLKKQVPEYRLAAERFENIRQVEEQLMSRDTPLEITNMFYGRTSDPEKKMYSSLTNIVEGLQRDDLASKPSRDSFKLFMDALENFQKNEADRIASNPGTKSVIPNVNDLRKFILDASDDSVLRGSSRATTQGRSLVPDFKEWIIGKAPTSAAYHAGKLSSKVAPIGIAGADLSRKLYKAPEQYLRNLASRLEAVPGLSSMGKALTESIENGSSYKKNAAIFTIMQNPNAKLFINADDLKDEEE